jgi:hypothetical protein
MGSISNHLEDELLDHLLGVGEYSNPATVYVGYSTADPTDDASGLAEPTGGNYSRKAITFGAAASRAIKNSLVTFDVANGAQGTITHWAVFDAPTAGNMMAHGALSEEKEIMFGNTPSFAAEEVEINFSSGGASDYLANKLLDFAFRNQAFAQPTIYVGLDTTITVDADTGSTVTEPSTTDYARVAHANWNTSSGGALSNNGAIEMEDSASEEWDTIVYAFLADADTAGNLLIFLDITDQTPGTGDSVSFADEDLDITLS